MSSFHRLRVSDVHKTIRDAVVVTLEPEDPKVFDFIQGQYLTFRHTIDGTELRRNYSICAGKDDGTLQVGIKRVEGGAFSSFANDNLAIGDVLEAMPPQGKFFTEIEPNRAKTYIGFAGGSGITPVLSILKTVLAREPNSRFTLVYANRAPNTIMFREELEDIKNTYMGRFTLLHVLETGEPDIELLAGRVDAQKCHALFAHWIDVGAVDTAFICGPEPMMHSIAAALEAEGLSKDQIKYELFGAAQEGRVAIRKRRDNAQKNGAQASVIIDGTAHQIQVGTSQSVLEAALAQNLDAPYACQAGVCSTCKAKLLEGEAEMVTNHALEDYEVRAGFVLTCQCFAVSDYLVLDYDQH